MENDWDVVRNDRGWPAGGTGMGILRITLLFGSAAIALALIIAPIADSQTRSYVAQDGGAPFGLDDIATGTSASRPTSIRSARACCSLRRMRSASSTATASAPATAEEYSPSVAFSSRG